MIHGIGCDIIQIDRVSALINKYGDHFKNKIFTSQEILNEPEGLRAISYYAKRLAAKEAFAKALGSGIGPIVGFKDIEIVNNSQGAPIITCDKVNHFIIHLSLSDEREFAIAYVIIEIKPL